MKSAPPREAREECDRPPPEYTWLLRHIVWLMVRSAETATAPPDPKGMLLVEETMLEALLDVRLHPTSVNATADSTPPPDAKTLAPLTPHRIRARFPDTVTFFNKTDRPVAT